MGFSYYMKFSEFYRYRSDGRSAHFLPDVIYYEIGDGFFITAKELTKINISIRYRKDII